MFFLAAASICLQYGFSPHSNHHPTRNLARPIYIILMLSKRCSSIALVKIETNVSASTAIDGLSAHNLRLTTPLKSERIVSDLTNGASTIARITSAVSLLSTHHTPCPCALSRYSFCSLGIAPSPTCSSVSSLSTPHAASPHPQPSFSVSRFVRLPASIISLSILFATPHAPSPYPLSRKSLSSVGVISFVMWNSFSPFATSQRHAPHAQLMSSASSAGKCSAVSVAMKDGMSPLYRSLPAHQSQHARPPKISMFFMLAYTPSLNMVVIYFTHGAPRLVPCASRSAAYRHGWYCTSSSNSSFLMGSAMHDMRGVLVQ